MTDQGRPMKKGKRRVDQLLVDRGLAESRSQARAMLMAGQVFQGEQRIDKAGAQLLQDAPLRVTERARFVSRGGEKLAHAIEVLIDESGLAVKDVHLRVRNLAVDGQGHIRALHCFEQRRESVKIRNTARSVRRHTRRIQLEGVNEAARLGAAYSGRVRLIGDVKRHERFEICARGDRCKDGRAVSTGALNVGGRWCEIGHDEPARKAARSIGYGALEVIPIPEMQVEIVGTGQRELTHRGILLVSTLKHYARINPRWRPDPGAPKGDPCKETAGAGLKFW